MDECPLMSGTSGNAVRQRVFVTRRYPIVTNSSGMRMAKTLTVKGIENLKPSAVRLEVPDGLIRGLFFVLQPSGKASWAVRYRHGRQPRKLTLGTYPAIDLKAARELASCALVSVARGGDPAVEKQARKNAERAPSDHLLSDKAVERFIERYAKANTRESSWREAERILQKEIALPWRGRPLEEISRATIHAILDAMVDRGAPIAANRSLAVMRRFFGWCVEREIIAKSPCEGVKAPSQTRSRDRILNDNELRAVWKACETLGWPFGPLVQLLILAGQRRDEVAEITWAEIDLEQSLWTLPRGRVKNDKGHTVPLSAQVVRVFEGLPGISSKRGFLFSTTGETAVSGFARAKERLDKLLDPEMPGWTFHDLRRTLASGCARLGFAPQVVEAILNHKSGTIRGVAAVYNRYDYADEKRAALDAWGRYVEGLVSDKDANVIKLAKRSATA